MENKNQINAEELIQNLSMKIGEYNKQLAMYEIIVGNLNKEIEELKSQLNGNN